MKKPEITPAQALARSLSWKEARSSGGWKYRATHAGHVLELWQELDPWELQGDQDRACTCLFLGGSRHTGKPWKAGHGRALDWWDKATNAEEFWSYLTEYGTELPHGYGNLRGQETVARLAGLALVETEGLNQYQDLLCYITKEDVRKEWGKGPAAYRKARAYLKAVMAEIQQVENGEMGGFSIEGPACADSCGGFVGLDYLKEEACAALLAGLAWEESQAKACAQVTRL